MKAGRLVRRTLCLPALAGDTRGPWREGEKGQIGETFRRQNHQDLVSDWISGVRGRRMLKVTRGFPHGHVDIFMVLVTKRADTKKWDEGDFGHMELQVSVGFQLELNSGEVNVVCVFVIHGWFSGPLHSICPYQTFPCW